MRQITLSPALLDTEGTAARLGMTPRQVQRLVKRGYLKRVAIPEQRKTVRFSAADVDAFVAGMPSKELVPG